MELRIGIFCTMALTFISNTNIQMTRNAVVLSAIPHFIPIILSLHAFILVT